MSFARITAVARAEMRQCRRLVRYWVFVGLSSLFGLLVYVHYCLLHAFFSPLSATAGILGPCYLVGVFGSTYLLVFAAGIVFLAFDLRARDEREQMVEVLDSRPMTNVELVAGRFIGLLLMAWLPLLALAVLLQTLGHLMPRIGMPVGEPIEPVSLATFVVPMALPAFACAVALVFVVTLLVRSRLLAAVLLLALLGGSVAALFRLPLTLAPLFDLTGMFMVSFPSELVPEAAGPVGWLQRLGIMLAAIGLVGLAGAVHPRLDGGSSLRTAGIALTVMALAAGLLVAGWVTRVNEVELMAAWRQAHEVHARDPVPDLVSLRGDVRIDPGDELAMDLELTLRAPAETTLQTVLLTLNPGIRVIHTSGGQGEQMAWSHRHGLLTLGLPAPLAAGAETTIRLQAAGRPDIRFGYLDAARVPETERGIDSQIYLLGSERAIFDRRFVALMPGVHWLPATGADVGRADPRNRACDFFSVDLTVDLPADWLAAGPGRRQLVTAGGERSRFSFSPGAPVSEVALIASRFVSYGAEIGDVHTELLVHPDHTKMVELFRDAWPEIEDLIGERLRGAADMGLPYPYDGFTVVEVPTVLRGYAGGWRLDTAMAPPAMLLLRESSLPTCRFDVLLRGSQRLADREGGVGRAKRDALIAFFDNDFSGGNPFSAMARNLFRSQTAARGAEGLALNHVTEEMSSLLLNGRRGYFTAHVFGPELNQAFQRVLQSHLYSGREDRPFSEAVIESFTSRPQVWQAVLGESLRQIEPDDDPQRTLDVLTLKGGALARSLLDTLGRRQSAQLLASLRTAHQGSTFTLAAVVAEVGRIDPQLAEQLEDWVATTRLPGFAADRGQFFRLRDAADSSPRYQLLVHVRNDEATPGVFRVVAKVGEEGAYQRLAGEPLRLAGHSAARVGMVLPQPPQSLVVEPYLSLNRGEFSVPLVEVNGARRVDAGPLEGSEELAWPEPDPRIIVVDDLDPGFATVEPERSEIRLQGKAARGALDQGLPLARPDVVPTSWSRVRCASGWGRYRHTVALIKAGDGTGEATFAAELPVGGLWDVELHLPDRRSLRSRSLGRWSLEVVHGATSRSIGFDAAGANPGWNPVHRLDLPAGEVMVRLRDRTDGDLVVADALRWSLYRTSGP